MVLFLISSTLFSSCSNITNVINPGLNNNGLRVSNISNISTDKDSEKDNSSNNTENTETLNSGIIQVGNINISDHNKITDLDKEDVNKNTLTDKDKKDLSNIKQESNSKEEIQIITPSVQGKSYINEYLKPFIEDILLKVKSNTNLTSSDLYINVIYRGLNKELDNSFEFVTYNNIYDSFTNTNYFYGNNPVAVVLLRYWQKYSSSLNKVWYDYKKEVNEFGNYEINKDGITKKAKNCNAIELIPMITSPSGNSEAIYYLFSSKYGNKVSNHLFSDYILRFEKTPIFDYTSSVTCLKQIFETIPIFKPEKVKLWDFLNIKEDPIKEDSHLFLRRISKSIVSSAFVKQEVNKDLGNNEILYKNFSIYGGSLYYFENANHLVAIILYCDKLWSNSCEQTVKDFIMNSLASFRNPTEITTSELSSLPMLN